VCYAYQLEINYKEDRLSFLCSYTAMMVFRPMLENTCSVQFNMNLV
jgi:hypothetical protein